MESVYHIVTIRVNKISCTHVWRLRSCYLGMGYDTRLLAHCALCITGYDNRIQNGSHDFHGPAKAQGSKVNPINRVSIAQSKQGEG
jgi:hypothetical protein